MARPNRYDSLEKPKGGAEVKVKVKDEQDIVFLAFFYCRRSVVENQ